MTAHSRVGASSAYRWLKCPASAKLSIGIKSESSTFAKEGTAAHELAEMCIVNDKFPSDYLGKSIEVEGDSYTVDQVMVDAVRDFIMACGYQDEVVIEGKLEAEKKFNLDWLAEGMFGTCDANILSKDTLYVIDFKYGAGKPVFAENNPQLMYYALGALGKPKGDQPKYVTMKIVQPRCEFSGTSSWTITTEELYEWAYNVLLPGVKATRETNPKFQIGEYCTWCPVFSSCPNLADIASGSLGVVVTDPVESQKLVLPEPERLTTEQKVRIMEFLNLAGPWLKEVESSIFKDAMSGSIIPGYKLVQKRLGNRRWTNPQNVINLYSHQVGDDLFEPRKLITPASLEKILGGGKEVKAEIDKLTERPDTGLELKPESDKRPAVELQNKVLDNLIAEYGESI